MGITEKEVSEIIHHFEQSWKTTKYGASRTTYQKGSVAVVVQHEGKYGEFIVTVLERTQEAYERKNGASPDS